MFVVYLGTTVQALAEYRFVFIEIAGHTRVLQSLAGEKKCHPAATFPWRNPKCSSGPGLTLNKGIELLFEIFV